MTIFVKNGSNNGERGKKNASLDVFAWDGREGGGRRGLGLYYIL